MTLAQSIEINKGDYKNLVILSAHYSLRNEKFPSHLREQMIELREIIRDYQMMVNAGQS